MERGKEFLHIAKLEQKKQTRRENRLKRIMASITAELQTLVHSDYTQEFEVVYKQIYERQSSVTGGIIQVPPTETPTYGIFIVSKEDSNNEYRIMYWLRSDLDSSKQNFEMLLNQSCYDNITEGIKYIVENNSNGWLMPHILKQD